jgi:hypothetical protein
VAQIIDRRLNGRNKSAINRQRFIKRFKGQIKKAVSDAVAGRSITDMENGENITIPARDISEPEFSHGSGGSREMIHPGNVDFVPGDQVDRPSGGGGKGNQASNDGEGEDDFAFELSRDEFLNFFFEDLELPDLVKTRLTTLVKQKSVRAGYTSDGNPSNINVVRSLKGALGRRIALSSPHLAGVRELEAELQQLVADGAGESPRALEIEEEILRLRGKIRAIPFIDTFDLRYNNRVARPQPSTQAVMFCIMDVSGSMDEARKDIAKRFFILLYLFLTRTYEKIELVFIRHHTIAKEVDEEDFFHSRESGGTVVSSALEVMRDIIAERYPTADWNIYAAQASDGDNWNEDSPICRNLLVGSIMPCVQYFAYIEITPELHQSLWQEYINVKAACPNFAMQHIESQADIYPVFRELFKKQTV